MPRELKPEDVMRALELHADCETDNCFECPYEKYLSKADGNCVHHLSMDALALLREIKKQIRDLEEDVENYKSVAVNQQNCNVKRYHTIKEKDAEIERLTAYNANLICANTDITNRHKDYVEEAERIARAEAITEFAERLKVHCADNRYWCELIDQIAKEMKGARESG